jgi:hypothetical protein
MCPEYCGEDLLEILSAINHISRQVVKPGPSCVGQVDGKKLDDKEVIIHHSRPACKAVVFQLNTRVDFVIILDDVVWRPETLWETLVAHIAPECLGPCPLRFEATPLPIVAPAVMWVTCVVLRVCPLIPLVSLMACRMLEASAQVAWPEASQNLCW